MALLEVQDLKVYFQRRRASLFVPRPAPMKAVDGISFTIEPGETYGLVGESGSGKTTTGRAIIGLYPATSGKIIFNGQPLFDGARKLRSGFNRDIQMIFQDPYSSLNPKKRVLDIIAEPLRNYERLSPSEERAAVQQLLEQVGLNTDSIYKYPHEFSGGQRQRIGIARAIALRPKLIIADEPVSALDLSVQAQVLNFLKDIQTELGLSYLFISHDLGIIKHMCDRIGIMYRGRYVEQGSASELFEQPEHIYTKRLLAAIPSHEPAERERRAEQRAAIQAEYEHAYDRYFDSDGLAYPLRHLSGTHYAASHRAGGSG